MGILYRHFLIVRAALAFVCLLSTNQVESSTSFELRLHRFVNPEGRDATGGCCGSGASVGGDLAATRPKHSAICPTERGCPVSFRICVKNYQAFVDSSSPCIIGEFMTKVFDDESLPRLNETPTPPIVFYFNFTWTGSFSFVIEAYHTSETNSERMLVSRFVAQRFLTAKLDWTSDHLTANQTQIELSYRVRCQASYFGEHCDILCKPRNDSFGHYTCRNDGQKVCMPGWEGVYCTTAVCRPGCHDEHGHCKQPYDCKCRHGWEGELCDTCSRYPGCEHGTCHDAWECTCNEGWGGLFCNQDLNYCTNHRPCKNGGICTNTGQGSYTCNCTEKYMGNICHVLRNPCQNNPCQNGGICSNPSDGNHTCRCPLGFYGPNCETSARICTPNPCENGGSCVHDPGGYVCECMPGFFGAHCEKSGLKCISEFCQNGGSCTTKPDGPRCKCRPGFEGIRCEIISCSGRDCFPLHNGACNSSPCQNGGLCKPEAEGFSCLCPTNFSGEHCQIHLVKHVFNINVPHLERSNYSTAISNISHQVSDEPKSESNSKVAVILTCSVIAVTVFVTCAICLAVKFLRRRQRRSKCYNETARENELQQNEKNIMRMNNNKCATVSQNKIVNTLDRIPTKVNNEAPAKVVNAQACNKKFTEKNNLLYIQRTLERRENNSSFANSGCHSSQDWSPSNTGTVFTIQDHLRRLPHKLEDHQSSRPLSLTVVERDIFATEV